jgi:hypothetical protein
MTSRIPFYISIFLLIVAGITLSMFRHTTYGVPWTPGETRQVWDVEARIEFNAVGKEAKVSRLSANRLHHQVTVFLI